MLVACWSVKGGSGTTVVAVSVACLLARHAARGAVIADLAGDVPAVLGLAEPPGPGLAEWLAAGEDVPTDALGRLEVEGPAGLRVLPLGHDPLPVGANRRAELLGALLGSDGRPAVADCGVGPTGVGLAVAGSASVSLLVLRPCYLALRRAVTTAIRPTGVVLVDEPGRSLRAGDVEDVLGVPVRAVVRVDPAVARAVDAGILASRLPKGLGRALRHAA